MAKKRGAAEKNGAPEAATKKPSKRRGKKSAPVELTDEEKALQARTRRNMNRQGIWEVSTDDGTVLGQYEGTPQRIGAYLVANHSKPVKQLYFQKTKIQVVPEEVLRETCCEKRFTKRDNFCSLCGNPRRVQPTIPKGVKVEIDVGS